jgi:hypothetical protein
LVPGTTQLHSLINHLLIGNLEHCSPPPTEFSILNHPSPNVTKYNEPTIRHNTWAASLSNNTILLYIDGTKIENGYAAYGTTTYCIENCTPQQLQNHHCNQGTQSKVYNAELHAVQEGLWLLRQYKPLTTVYIGMDKEAAIQTLSNNLHNYQFIGNALMTAWELMHRGWIFFTI